jgi:hypothetical protein
MLFTGLFKRWNSVCGQIEQLTSPIQVVVWLLLLTFVGCGGGTYGSGGDDSKIRVLVLTQDSVPLKDVLIRSAGFPEATATDDRGTATVRLNPALPWSLIRLQYGKQSSQDRYLETDAVLAADGPIGVEYGGQKGSTSSLGPEFLEPCEEILSSWETAIATETSGLSERTIAAVQAILATKDSCENKVPAIADTIFAP